MPVLHGVEHEAYNWTWSEKRPIAFWHGTSFCRPHPLGGHWLPCTRISLPQLTDRYPDLINITTEV